MGAPFTCDVGHLGPRQLRGAPRCGQGDACATSRHSMQNREGKVWMSGPFRTSWGWGCRNFTATADGSGRLSRVDVGVDVGVVAVLRQQCSNIRYIFLYDSC